MGLNLKSTSSKVLASAALLAAAAGVAGMGTYGGFTASTSASAAVASGTVKFDVGTGTGDNIIVAASGAVPGDSMQRVVTLSNSGNQDLASVMLTTSAVSPSTKLDSDPTNGLQVKIEACSSAWKVETAPANTYSCAPASTTTVLSSRAVVGASMPLTGLASVAAGKTDNLRITLSVPDSADNTFQGLNSKINFAFTAIQRGAASK